MTVDKLCSPNDANGSLLACGGLWQALQRLLPTPGRKGSHRTLKPHGKITPLKDAKAYKDGSAPYPLSSSPCCSCTRLVTNTEYATTHEDIFDRKPSR